MQKNDHQKNRWGFQALAVSALSLMALPAAAGIISVNFESTLNIDGIATAVDGNFLLDSSADLSTGFNESVVVGGAVTIGDFMSGPILLDTPFTYLFVTSGGSAIAGEDGPGFWGIEMFFSDLTPDNFFDFILSDAFNVGNLTAGRNSQFLAFIPGGPAGGAVGNLENLSANFVSIDEPASVALLLIGAAAILGRRRRV